MFRKTSQVNEYRVLINDQPWNIFEAGSGTPMLFLHNGGGTLWNWAHQLQYFTDTYRVIAPDLPGFGRSHRPAQPLTLDAYVDGLERLLEILDCPQPILVGNCIGASIALEFALRYPEKVSALTLFNICGGPPMLNPFLRVWSTAQPITAFGVTAHRVMIEAAAHPALRKFGTSLLYADHEPTLHPQLESFLQAQQSDPDLRASLYWLAKGLDSFSIFSQPRQKPVHFPPVLLGWGAKNRTLHPRWADQITDWLKPQEFWLVENAGHMPMYEQPEQVNARLEQFLRVHL
ncbi:MAG TPA: alpha/beta hydrolase [Anaerolineales bacterium]|nr:alpha/beta hydrolase [Anaerolineales bacterium]